MVKRGATIGANATVICGHTIGQYAFVGAGAVVTRDVADGDVVAGVPAPSVARRERRNRNIARPRQVDRPSDAL